MAKMEVDNPVSLNGSFADDEQTENGLSPRKPCPSAPKSLALSVSVTPPGFKSSDISPQDTGSEKKKRIRRKNKGGKHHRKWKPYTKLSWDEKKILEEKEGRKAAQRREQRFASGQAMAPYNTTQFLMDLHDPDPKYECAENDSHRSRARRNSVSVSNHDGSGSIESSDEYYSSPDDEEIFLEKEFSLDYENYHAEHIRSLSKEQLVKEYIEMERKCEQLEKELRHDSSSSEKEKNVIVSPGTTEVTDKSAHMDELFQKLRAENEQLRKENEQLRSENVRLTSDTAATENKENNPET